MRSRRLVIVAALGALGLAACETTKLEFRSPRGSFLNLQRTWNNPGRRVEFPSSARVEFCQFAPQDADEGAECTGEIRIDGEIETERVPPGAERYFIRNGDEIRVRVKGYYWIYRYDKTIEDELTVHYVDITPAQIYDLLEGRAVTVSSPVRNGERVYRFLLGVELPDART